MTFDEAKEHLSECVKPDGTLDDIGWYLYWASSTNATRYATLDGEFTADDLIAIGTYMKEYKE